MPTTRSRRGRDPSPSATPSSPSPSPSPTGKSGFHQSKSSLNITRKVLRSSTSNFFNSSHSGRRGSRSAVVAYFKKPFLVISGLNEDLLVGFEADSQLRDSMPVELPESGEHDAPEEENHDEPDSAPDDPPFRVSTRGRGGRRGRGRGRPRGRPRRAAPFSRIQYPNDSASTSTSGDADHPRSVHAPSEDQMNSRSNFEGSQKGHSDGPDARKGEPTQISGALEPTATAHSNGTAQSTPKLEARGRKRGGFSRQNSAATQSGLQEEAAQPPEPVTEDVKDLDLPPPFLEKYKVPKSSNECEDKADFILKTRFEPMTNPQAFITALTKHQPNLRSTEVLYAIALNAQRALKAWQDEYLRLDKRTAPQQHPPRKPATGGRLPMDPELFEAMKQADLYNYSYDTKKGPHQQDPYAQRLGRDLGRQLRQRRKRDALDSAAVSEEEPETESGPRKRQRRAVQRFEGTATPEFGARGTRKRIFAQRDEESATPETEGRPKRTRVSTLIPQRIVEMRVESAANSSSEGEKQTPNPPRRRGRPPGSKNFAKRSDAGIKKGPRKRTLEAAAAAASAAAGQAVGQAPTGAPGQQAIQPAHNSTTGLTPRQAPRGLAPLSAVLAETPEARPVQPRSTGPSRTTAPHTPGSASGTAQSKTTPSSGTSIKSGQPKTRAKSEKRSQSMTIWWAERKARAAEAKLAQAKASGQLEPSASTTVSKSTFQQSPPGGRGKRSSGTAQNRQSSLSQVVDLTTTTSSPQQPQPPLSLPPLAPSVPPESYQHSHMRHGFEGHLPPPQQHHQLPPSSSFPHPPPPQPLPQPPAPSSHQHSLPPPGHHGAMHQPPPPVPYDHPYHQPNPPHPPPHGPHQSLPPPPTSSQTLPPPPPPRTQPILAPAPVLSPSQSHSNLHPPHMGPLPFPAIQPQPPPGHPTRPLGAGTPHGPLFSSFPSGRWGPGQGRAEEKRS